MDGFEEGLEEDFAEGLEDDFAEGFDDDLLKWQEDPANDTDDTEAGATLEGSGGDPETDAGDTALQARIEAAAKQKFDAFFERQYGGLVNPLNGQPVQSEADLLAYQQAVAEVEYHQRMTESGIDPEALHQIIGNHPAILQAQRLQQEQQQREAESFAKNQMESLLEKYPDCGLTDINQLAQSPKGQAVLQDWGRTGDLVKAYTANYADEILERRTAAAKQGKLNEMNSKRHLSPARGAAASTESMSQEEYKVWKGFFPEASYAQIQKMWKENKEG